MGDGKGFNEWMGEGMGEGEGEGMREGEGKGIGEGMGEGDGENMGEGEGNGEGIGVIRMGRVILVARPGEIRLQKRWLMQRKREVRCNVALTSWANRNNADMFGSIDGFPNFRIVHE